jgi:hypothetical protein
VNVAPNHPLLADSDFNRRVFGDYIKTILEEEVRAGELVVMKEPASASEQN